MGSIKPNGMVTEKQLEIIYRLAKEQSISGHYKIINIASSDIWQHLFFQEGDQTIERSNGTIITLRPLSMEDL